MSKAVQDQAPSRAARKLTRLERFWPWLLLGLFTALIFCGLIFALSQGVLEATDPILLGRNLRGYTIAGIALGVITIGLSLLASGYSLRKRGLQEARVPFKGSMMAWLWGHVMLGLLALLTAVLHAGYGTFSLSFSSGKVLFVVFAVLVVSGIAWRLVYKFVPPAAAARIRNYSQPDSESRVRELLVEIEKASAGRSERMQQVKDWILQGTYSQKEIEAAIAMLPNEEKALLVKIQLLAERRTKTLRRHRLQARYHRILQDWRLVHIPLVALFGIFFILHLITAFDLPSRLLPAQFEGYPSAEECAACHAQITEQWRNSMHAHAVLSPVTIVQTNQVISRTVAGQASPDPFLICNNCHAPVGAQLTGQGTLPLEAPFPMSDEVVNEGVACSTCHQFEGEPVSGGGGLAAVFQEDLRPGGIFFGTIEDPVGNAYHRSRTAPVFSAPETLCMNCHNVNYDRDANGEIEPGVDLILQTTYDEFVDYQELGGQETCITCHMPLLEGTRVAEAALIPLEQDFEAPEREVRDHSFVGVDYPLDKVAESDPQAEARAVLLQSAAILSIDPASLDISAARDAITFSVSLTNAGAGHNLPTGFAFARQMWLEVVVTDQDGNVLFSSGVLPSNVSDLCDAGSLDDALADFLIDCEDGADPQLVNFQQKLLDEIDIRRDENGEPVVNDDGEHILAQGVEGEETFLQHLTGGAVARTRPADGQVLTRIEPFESRSFLYSIPLAGEIPDELTVVVRLLFRNLPPYFLRALAANQPEDEIPQLAPLIENLQIVEMAASEFTFTLK